MTNQLHRQVRLLNVAKAFGLLATHAEQTFAIAVDITEDTLESLESTVHNITKKMNGDSVAAILEAVISHPFVEPAPSFAGVVAPGGVKGRTNGEWTWRAVENPHGSLGNKFDSFVADFHGLKCEVAKRGPANYEGRINDATVLSGKFKKNVRERLQREAEKRIG